MQQDVKLHQGMQAVPITNHKSRDESAVAFVVIKKARLEPASPTRQKDDEELPGDKHASTSPTRSEECWY